MPTSAPGPGAGNEHTDLVAVTALADPKRRRVYAYAAGAGGAVTRDEVGTALGMDRSLAAYHLDKLVEAGLLRASFARPPGVGGPGAGRPAKRYERSEREYRVALPPRDYRLLAALLARAAEADPTGVVQAALQEAAGEVGAGLAAGGPRDLLGLLEILGFEPYDDGQSIRLRNCPFHEVARTSTALVCGMNLALLGGLAAAVEPRAAVRLDPAPGRCCVAFTRPPSSAG